MNTFKIEIDLPEYMTITPRGIELAIALVEMSAETIADAAMHGVKQAVQDAASAAAQGAYETANPENKWSDLAPKARKEWTLSHGDAVVRMADALMQKKATSLVTDGWQSRAAAAPGLSVFDQYRGELLMAKLTFPKGTSKADKIKAGLAKYADLAEAQKAKVDALVQSRIERERAEAALDLDF